VPLLALLPVIVGTPRVRWLAARGARFSIAVPPAPEHRSAG
jgi:hypothetical protein